MELIAGAGRFAAPESGQLNDWVEHMASADLSIGTYCIPAGGVDDQQPHTEDEVYVVQSGRAVLVTPSGSVSVGPGSVVFVPAGEPHRFTPVTEDLAMVVVFGPPYGARR